MRVSVSHCESLIQAIDRYLAKADDDLANTLAEEGRALPKESVKMESALEDAMTAALTEQTALIIRRLKQKKSVAEFLQTLDELSPLDRCDKAIAQAAKEQFVTYLPKVVSVYAQAADSGIKVTAVSKRTTAWVDEWSEELGRLMKLDSHEQIKEILHAALENGDGVEEAARAILDSGIRNERYKARRAAMTEMFRAQNKAQAETAMQLPSVVGKRWRHIGVGKPRPNHQQMNGKEVPKAEPFVLKGRDGKEYRPNFPLDPCLPPEESINCHCIIEYVTDDSVLALPPEERQRLRDEAIKTLDEAWEREVDAKYRKLAGLKVEETKTSPTAKPNAGKSKYTDITGSWYPDAKLYRQ